MKKFFLLTLGLVLTLSNFANSGAKPLSTSEASKVDLSGKWVGKRHQYNADKSAFIQHFEYEFELKQEGNQVTGYSTILNADGNYADILLRGVVVGNKLQFEEYQIKNQAQEKDRVWCFKAGELTISKVNGSLSLSGATPSFIPEYFIPCTGGVTQLMKADNSNNTAISIANEDPLNDNLHIQVFPNPFFEKAQIVYALKSDSKVSLEIMDITGKQVAQLENNVAKNSGTYTVDFNGKANGYAAGIFIAKLTINGEVYSRQLVQTRY